MFHRNLRGEVKSGINQYSKFGNASTTGLSCRPGGEVDSAEET